MDVEGKNCKNGGRKTHRCSHVELFHAVDDNVQMMATWMDSMCVCKWDIHLCVLVWMGDIILSHCRGSPSIWKIVPTRYTINNWGLD